MNKEHFYRNHYNKLNQEERELLLLSIAKMHPQFTFLRYEAFDKFGMQINTAIYLYLDHEFVFVPGDTVTLGWESFVEGMNKESLDDITESLADVDDVDSFLQESMSPIREVKISPMLVERKPNEIGWRDVLEDSEELLSYKTRIEEFIKEPYQTLTFHKSLRITKKNTDLRFQMFETISYKELLKSVDEEGLSIPTEDEWEYICGGGKRTLFRWGDSFDFAMKLKHFESVEEENMPYPLELPNQFGLVIGYDPYKYEVVDSTVFLKGGDGGASICGGLGILIGYLPVSTYFRPREAFDDELDYKSDIGGDYAIYRRVMRLDK